MATTVTLSSVGTAVIPLDYIGAGTASAFVTSTSTTNTVTATVEFTLDDPMRSSSPTWIAASSISFSSTILQSSGAYFTFLTPIAGVRVSVSAISSSAVRMKALQTAGG
jgi:hypothetical protein